MIFELAGSKLLPTADPLFFENQGFRHFRQPKMLIRSANTFADKFGIGQMNFCLAIWMHIKKWPTTS